MNTEKRVNERIAKVALKNQKVDLSLIDDLRKSENQLKELSAKANGDGLSQVQKAVIKADRAFSNLLRAAENAQEIADKYIAAAKELGVDDKEARGIKNLAAALENDAEFWVKELNASQYN